MASLTEVITKWATETLLGIITSVEAGVTTPKDAMIEVEQLKSAVPGFKIDYTLADFEKILISGKSAYTGI